MAGLSSLPSELRALRPVEALERNVEKGRLAHAILLKGEDLPRLDHVARALAASLLHCEGDPLLHPDCFTLRPAKKSRSIAVGKRGQEEDNTMRRLLLDLQQTSNRGGYKVALVYEADRMNAAAANAFLKTLEEPPRQTVLLLLSTRPYDLMETIRSRCFQFRLPSRTGPSGVEGWSTYLEDYRRWIHFLRKDPDAARKAPGKAVLMAYGLIARFLEILAAAADAAWKEQKEILPEHLGDEEKDALQVGLQKGVRDKLLIDLEEATRIAAIELSHEIPFPSLQLTRAIGSLESITGLLALNMRDETALEYFFLQSLRIWTQG